MPIIRMYFFCRKARSILMALPSMYSLLTTLWSNSVFSATPIPLPMFWLSLDQVHSYSLFFQCFDFSLLLLVSVVTIISHLLVCHNLNHISLLSFSLRPRILVVVIFKVVAVLCCLPGMYCSDGAFS